MTARARALRDVNAERERQEAKWGAQRHEDGTGPLHRLLFPTAHTLRVGWRYPDIADLAKRSTDSRARAGKVTFADILLEEVFEAMAEDDPAKLRAELVQVAAVAVQWVEVIDEREAAQ